MSQSLHYDEVLDYLHKFAPDYRQRDFNGAIRLLLTLVERIKGYEPEAGLDRLAYWVSDDQRRFLKTLAQVANRLNDKKIAQAITAEIYHAQKEPRFGEQNPEQFDFAFWEFMIQRGGNAWSARTLFKDGVEKYRGPVWSFQRFGMSETRLPDGGMVYIAGEHEDWYDPDFYIYNDVIVVHPNLEITIYGYPRTVFPPTDFHSATLVSESIYIIGCLGHYGTRVPGETRVYRLDCQSFQIERIETEGESPGWIHKHTAQYNAKRHAIKLTQGEVFMGWDEEKQMRANRKTYWLDLATRRWQ